MQAVSDVLDRIVWAEDFGVTSTTQSQYAGPGGSLVQSRFREQFQRAINELYLNHNFINSDNK